jgi:hypothetical protein
MITAIVTATVTVLGIVMVVAAVVIVQAGTPHSGVRGSSS